MILGSSGRLDHEEIAPAFLAAGSLFGHSILQANVAVSWQAVRWWVTSVGVWWCVSAPTIASRGAYRHVLGPEQVGPGRTGCVRPTRHLAATALVCGMLPSLPP
jgi:hypothetical protein